MWKWDYAYVQNFFNKKEIKKLNNLIEKNYLNIEDHSMVSTYADSNKSKKKTKTYEINFGKIKPFVKNLEEIISELNETNFNYDLFSLKDSSNTILKIYDSKEKSHYDWHFDTSRSDIYDIKFTVIINLSIKKYSGGSFQIFNSGEYDVKELDKPGSLVMIKSYLNHRVLPVTSGERRSLVLFIRGPKLR